MTYKQPKTPYIPTPSGVNRAGRKISPKSAAAHKRNMFQGRISFARNNVRTLSSDIKRERFHSDGGKLKFAAESYGLLDACDEFVKLVDKQTAKLSKALDDYFKVVYSLELNSEKDDDESK